MDPPDWLSPALEDVYTWESLARRVLAARRQPRHQAAVAVFDWALHEAPAPARSGGASPPAELAAARDLAELAPGEPAEWGYGAWRALAWLLGTRTDAPVQLWEGPPGRRPWEVLPASAHDELATADPDPPGP